MLEVSGVKVSYAGRSGPPLFDSLHLRIGAGEIAVLTGPSGAGKSTLARTILGVPPPGACVLDGLLTWQGRTMPASSRQHRSGMALVTQEPGSSLSPFFSIASQIEDVLKARSEPNAAGHCRRLLASVGLAGKEDAPVHQLSSGQRQRAAFARALASAPQLLIADEPVASLDGRNRESIQALVSGLARESGLAVLWITHLLPSFPPSTTTWYELTGGALRPQPAPSPLALPGVRRPNTEAPAVLQAKGLTKHYTRRESRETALDDVSLSLRRGCWVAISGPSGAGKSTLARCLAGLERPDRGTVTFPQQPGASAEEIRRRVQLMMPDPATALNPRFTVLETVLEPLRFLSSERNRRQAALEWLGRVGLDSAIAARKVTELSGGQRRRLLLARTLATGARILILDEPTAGLDRVSARQILELLRDLQRQQDLSLIWITHETEFVHEYADALLHMDAGRLSPAGGVAEGPSQ